MNDSSTRTPEKTDRHSDQVIGSLGISQDVALTSQSLPQGPFQDPVQETIVDEEATDSKSRSDSEAETVVQTGKDNITPNPVRKVYTYEGFDGSDDAAQGSIKKNPKDRRRKHSESDTVEKIKAPQESLSNLLANTNNSSNLSSARSSPIYGQQSPIEARSKSRQNSPHPESRTVLDGARSRKRKRETRLESTNDSHKRSSARGETSSEAKNQRDSREPRKAKKPAPLHVDHPRKDSEEAYAESDDSGSIHTNSYFRRLASGNYAVSPVKIPHKKLRDKNGRTLLARACATDEADHVRTRLQDRPEDLDIADNAGNTPLQIASLEGHAEVVKILLGAGCDTACKNIDLDTPLIDAVENGHLDVVRLLLKAGLDPRQSNAKGEEPLDLLDLSDDNGEEIKAALIEARGKDTRRRHSEEQHVSWGTRRDSVSVHSSRGSPPLHYPARSPSGNGAIHRRKTARSEATRNELLWIHPSAENLRERAAVNDVESVTRILEMRQDVDIKEAVLIAARAGHEQLLNLLLAIGQTEPDPDPLQSSSYTEGRNTPMLAAIGRGNVEIVRLLLSKPGFDPTRRLHRGFAYYELAKDRKGDSWEEEHKILKEAYDNFIPQSSPKGLIDGIDGQDQDGRRLKSRNLSPSSHESTRRKISNTGPKDTRVHKTRNTISRNATAEKSEDNLDRGDQNSGKQQHNPTSSSRASSVAVSDPETGAALENTKTKRSSSDTGSHQKHVTKPRRKLITGREYNSGKAKKRRDPMSPASSSSDQENIEIKTENPSLPFSTKEDTSTKTPITIYSESRKKRSRRSFSPVNNNNNQLTPTVEIHNKSKRRIHPDTESISPNGSGVPQPGSAAVANMVPSPREIISNSSAPPPGAAPVAFMGNSNASPITSPINVPISEVNTKPVATGIDQPIQDVVHGQEPRNLTQTEEMSSHQHNIGVRDNPGPQPHLNTPLTAEMQDQQQRDQEMHEKSIKDKADEAERQSRIAREEEEAILSKQHLEEQRKIDEAKNKARLEREEKEAREAEEIRVEKKRRDDEMQRKRAEQERLRIEEQERKRSEHEENERLAKLRKQQEEEQKKRESLPNALRRLMELKLDDARTTKEVKNWLPIYTVTGKDLDPSCSNETQDEKWMINLQAAPILGIADLDLPQCKLHSTAALLISLGPINAHLLVYVP